MVFLFDLCAQDHKGEKVLLWLNQAEQAVMNKNSATAIQLANKVLVAYDTLETSNAFGKAYEILGRSYTLEKDFGVAIFHFLQAQEIYQKEKDKAAITRVNLLLATMYGEWGIHKRAGTYYTKVVPVVTGDQWYEVVKKAAMAFEKGNDLDSALVYYELLNKKLQESPDSVHSEIETLHVIVNLQKQLGQDSLGIISNQRILKLGLASEDWENVVLAYNNLGYLQKKTDDLEGAIESFKKGLAVLKEQEVGQAYEASYLINLGVLSQNIEEYADALTYLNDARELLANSNDPRRRAQVENVLADLNLGIKNYYQAKIHHS